MVTPFRFTTDVPLKVVLWLAVALALESIVSMPSPIIAQQPTTPSFKTPSSKTLRPKLPQLPGYAKYQQAKKNRKLSRHVGKVKDIRWAKDGSCVVFTANRKRQQLNFATGKITPSNNVATVGGFAATGRGSFSSNARHSDQTNQKKRPPVPRAQQRRSERSPDGTMTAIYKDYNVWIRKQNSVDLIPITTEGSNSVRYGTGCWVYGEELDQDTAMWWSPDSTKLAFYEIDERSLKDYVITTDNTRRYTSTKTVRYPKAGDANPRARLLIYDFISKQTKRIPINDPNAEYIYDVRFFPDGKRLLFNQANRRQDRLDVVAVDVDSNESRVIVSETQPTWQHYAPTMFVLNEGDSFIWETERTGWKNFELRDFGGNTVAKLTHFAEFPCDQVEWIDESAGLMYFSAYSDATAYNRQLHRCRLDGTEQIRITTASLNHSNFHISPDHRWVVATAERFDQPRATVLYSTDKSNEKYARGVSLVAKPPLGSGANNELLSFPADDGQTMIYATLQKPSDFDPQKQYPLLIDVYGGPLTKGISNEFTATNPICELGFLVAKIGNRGTIGRGKAFESATYKNLGGVDLADQVAGVRHLTQRPYIDANRVGIYGHSYGGYLTALALLKHPDVFRAGVSGSPVTDWRNYDTIYTERYMQTPTENASGYEAASCLSYAKQLDSSLLLVHGLVDDNVHPANTWQLIEALQKNDQRFDLMIYPKFAHGIESTYPKLRLEYLHQHLIAK